MASHSWATWDNSLPPALLSRQTGKNAPHSKVTKIVQKDIHPMQAPLPILITCLAFLTACTPAPRHDSAPETLNDINVIDAVDLNAVMLNAADPNEAVTYFARASTSRPERLDLRRGHALSLSRAKRFAEATPVWARVNAHPAAAAQDRLNWTDSLIRSGDWVQAKAVFAKVPQSDQSFARFRLAAILADHSQDWPEADGFYEKAAALTPTPAGIFNNWGYSKLTRRDFPEAQRLFTQAIRLDPDLFTAKNNLALARGAQGKYSLPVIPMTQTERAQLLHTLALAAIKRGDVETGKALLLQAIESHPRHFDAAVQSLRALEAGAASG